jgi:4-amino-4-deoxy-L-arabinose transferase-like glycosyltransferase
MKILARLGAINGIQWYIALIASSLSLIFTFVVYPMLANSSHAVLDPDWHGPLGFGIWKLHSFSYYPSSEPASARGPLYPALIAGMLAVTNGWWPYSVQLAQCVIFGLLCALVFSITKVLWNRSLAVLACGLCAIHPFLIWYTSRIWIETLMIFLFTALIGSIVHLKQRPTYWRALLVGLILGLSVLAKSIYLPFLVLTPLLLLLPPGGGLRPALAAIVLVSGFLVVTPWIIRNGRVTGIYAPVVGGSGFTLHHGNDFIEDFRSVPFSISGLFPLSVARMKAEPVMLPPTATRLQRQNLLDAAWGRSAIAKLMHSPGFLLKKITCNLFLFWTFSDTAIKSICVAALQLPLVTLFAISLLLRRRQINNDALWICAALIALFYCAHLPTLALARYSVVLVPSMLMICVGIWAPKSIRA